MRPIVAVVALVGVVLAVPSEASSRTRDLTFAYQQAQGVVTGSDPTTWGSPIADATSQSDEDRVTISVSDPGGPVALAIDVIPPGAATQQVVTCQGLTTPVSAGTEVLVTPLAGECADGTLSVPEGGTITVSFHKRVPPRPRLGGAPPSMRWAVLVGVQHYAGDTHPTVGALGDVAAIRKALLASGWLPNHILVLTDTRATASGILAGFRWLAEHSGPRTFSLFHFSGHVCIASRGPCGSGHTYLWAQDNRFIPEYQVTAWMDQVQGYSWLDVAGCEAGAFAMYSSTRMFTGSSRANETSYESDSWHESIWTGVVWDAGFIDGQADNRHKAYQATIGEMTGFGVRHAPRMTASMSRGPQHPVVLGGSPNWTLYAPPGG